MTFLQQKMVSGMVAAAKEAYEKFLRAAEPVLRFGTGEQAWWQTFFFFNTQSSDSMFDVNCIKQTCWFRLISVYLL